MKENPTHTVVDRKFEMFEIAGFGFLLRRGGTVLRE
jgi:hypothetical protein